MKKKKVFLLIISIYFVLVFLTLSNNNTKFNRNILELENLNGNYQSSGNDLIMSHNSFSKKSPDSFEEKSAVEENNNKLNAERLTADRHDDFAYEVNIFELKKNRDRKIKVSLAGDFTIGSDEEYGYNNSFVHEVDRQNNDYNYFIKNFKPIFERDDLSLVNLETTLTTATKKAEKKFRFKGDPDYVNILKLADVEAVNIANNHTYDYLQQGFTDTIQTLKDNDIGFFGYDYKYLTIIKGIRIGVLGYEGWGFSEELKTRLKKDLESLKKDSDLIIVSYHWGIQNSYYPENSQIKLAHFTIDNGADLVFGHHPHVIQGIEKYKDKYIVYSLGNFLYGGHRNPADKDTFIFQQTFHFGGKNKLKSINDIKIIPFSISSVSFRNDFSPTPLEGEDKERFLKRIETYSSVFDK